MSCSESTETASTVRQILDCRVMALARHVDPETIIESLRGSHEKAHNHNVHVRNATSSLTPYSSRYNSREELSKFKIAQSQSRQFCFHMD